MAPTKAPKKRTLSAAGRKRIAEAQKRRWQHTEQAQSPVKDDAAIRKGMLEEIARQANELTRLQTVIRSLEVCDEDTKETLADYGGILKREYQYHILRAEELKRDLQNNGFEV